MQAELESQPPATAARTALAECLAAAQTLDGADGAACRQLAQRLAEGTFNLVVAGEFNRGKSSVINALLGAAVLPVAVVPLTSVVTVVRHGDVAGAIVTFSGGKAQSIALADIAPYATEKGNPGNVKGVDHVTVTHPSERLRGGIRIIDTPGIGSVHQHNTDVALRFLPQADAVLFVASVDQPLGRAELDFLAEIRRYASKVFCVLNKADYLKDDDLRESLDFTTRVVRDALQADVPVIPFSARVAGDNPQQGGLPELNRALARLLGEERRAVWLASLARGLQRVLQQARLAIQLELKALNDPLQQIEANLALFEAKKGEALQRMRDDDVLLQAETKRLQKDGIEPALERFKAELTARLQASVQQRFEALKDLPLKKLRAELEAHAIAHTRVAYDAWRAERDAQLARDFGRLAERFWGHTQDIADELLTRSAQLFSLAFEATRAASTWQPQADFCYKFWSEPTGLSQLGSSLVLLLPAFAGARIVRERAQQFAADLAETQAGRIRHDFEERLKVSAGEIRAELQARMEATIAGIEGAIRQGIALRARGEQASQSRRRQLDRSAAEIERLLERIGPLTA
jgi:GTP-binding protein EngB required for normal cell division